MVTQAQQAMSERSRLPASQREQLVKRSLAGEKGKSAAATPSSETPGSTANTSNQSKALRVARGTAKGAAAVYSGGTSAMADAAISSIRRRLKGQGKETSSGEPAGLLGIIKSKPLIALMSVMFLGLPFSIVLLASILIVLLMTMGITVWPTVAEFIQ